MHWAGGMGGVPARGLYLPGGYLPGVYLPRGMYLPRGRTCPGGVPAHGAVQIPLECILVSCIYFENIVKMYDERPIKPHFLERPLISQFITVAHPGFPVGGGAKPPWGATYNFAKISRKLHGIENFLGRRGCAPVTPLDPPMS